MASLLGFLFVEIISLQEMVPCEQTWKCQDWVIINNGLVLARYVLFYWNSYESLIEQLHVARIKPV